MWEERLNQLTDADREQVWLLRDEGQSLTAIAKRFNVSISTISRLVSNRRQVRNVKRPAAANGSSSLRSVSRGT